MVRSDLAGHRQPGLAGCTDEGQAVSDGVVAELSSQFVLLDHFQREPGGGNFTFRWPPLFVGRGIRVHVEQFGVFTVKADRAPTIVRQGFLEFGQGTEEQVTHTGAHVGLVGDRGGQRSCSGPDTGVEGHVDSRVA